METKIHYVYLTTNLINGKQYIGDHTIGANGNQYYLGSGSYFCNAVKKYGENNFFKEILEWFETREEASVAQSKYIKQFNTLKPNGYNISPTGGLGIQGCHSEETKKQIKISCKGKTCKKVYTLINPNGDIFENVSLMDMCRKYQLNFDTLRKHINYGKIKVNKTYNIKQITLNCENWQVKKLTESKQRRNILWTLISPTNIYHNLYKHELFKFVTDNNLNWRLLTTWKNKGKIKIKNKKLCTQKTLNTIGWEFINYTKWKNN